jgi:hypothetical protein
MHRSTERSAGSAARFPGRRRTRVPAFLAVGLSLTLGACSSPLDVSEAERAAAATCESLQPLVGVASASCVVDDGGIDAGIARDTAVELNREVTAEQVDRVIATWLSSKDGGFDEYEVSGSRATPLRLSLETVTDVSFSVAPGAAPIEVAFVQEWLSRAQQGMPISASVGDSRTIRVADETLSPSRQAALLDEFSMQTRTDLLTLAIGSDSTIESPVPASLGAVLRGFDAAYLGFAENDPDHELAFTVQVFTGEPPRLGFRIPTAAAPATSSGGALTDAPGWGAIRTVLTAAAPGGDSYTVSLTARPGQVIGRFSTSGCEPQLSGPEPQFGGELQTQWAAIHDVAPRGTCGP